MALKPSTKAFREEARRTPGYSLFDWLHGYVYARWPYLYIGIGTGGHWLACILGPLVHGLARLFPPRPADDSDHVTFADTYHGKVVPLDAATQLVTVEEEIRLTDLEKIIPYARARDIVLQNPGHIVVLECPCRASRPNPCLPLDVCLIVGEPFASFVAEHHPRRSRWVTPGEAAEILRAEDERGHVHHAFFKDAMLGRFYAICNCCQCCCRAIAAKVNYDMPMLASSGYVAQVDEALCNACGICQTTCPFGAVQVNETAVVSWENCMGCGSCVGQCAEEAISLARDEGKGEPLDMRLLVQEQRAS